MGRDHGNQRSGADEFAGAVDQGRHDRPGYLAATVLETFVRVADHGGADTGHCMRQHRKSAAGESGGAEARNGGAAQHGRGTIPPDPSTPDRKPVAGVDRRRAGSVVRNVGDSVSYGPAGERKGKFHSASRFELARAGRGGGTVDDHGSAVRIGSGASVDARGCDADPEGNAGGSAAFGAFFSAQLEPCSSGESDRDLPAVAGGSRTVRTNAFEPAIDPVGLQPRRPAAVPDERAAGGTPGSGNYRVLQRFAKTVQRDSRRAQRECLAFSAARGRLMAGKRCADRQAANTRSDDAYFDDRSRVLYHDADSSAAGKGD